MSVAGVAVVTGASRGVGRGVATALGAHGYTVYVTGRTQRPGGAPGDGSVQDTAAAVTAAGGRGVAVRVDHRHDDQAAALFERVGREEGRLDLLVSNAALIGDELLSAVPFWEKPLAASTDLLEVGLRSSLVASYYAAPLLVQAGGGLVVFTSAPGAVRYQYGAAYGAHKAALDKFAADMAVDFRPFGVTAVSLWLGAVLTERLRQIIGQDPGLGYLNDIAETPEFAGHVIAALAADPDVLAVSGRTLIGAEVARQYGISDRGGRQPPSVRELMHVEPASDPPGPVTPQGKEAAMTEDQLQQLLRDVQYLKDRQAILDVIMRHARGHDRHDTELMNSCFWADGVDEHGQFVTPGPQYGQWANQSHAGGYFLHMHNITNHTCEIDGATAHCETYVIGALLPRPAPGRAKFVSGRYLDRLEKRDGEWKILVRRTTIEVEVEGDSKWPENAISETFPKGAWDTGDLSYARPLRLESPSLLWDGRPR
ncbi:MAG TPA: SDR family NAD(P)-dependent oxidoreductase [Streptosporangiaceae bacterium]|nr:SDR family NAD(P)-dependent oxidoreductase [Streptosporangiaceae bacterium]